MTHYLAPVQVYCASSADMYQSGLAFAPPSCDGAQADDRGESVRDDLSCCHYTKTESVRASAIENRNSR